MMATKAFIQLEVQLTQCVTTVIDAALLTLSHTTAPRKSKSQTTARTPEHSRHSQLGDQCKA